MERTFPVILCELRKEKGISQKEAAAALGISQALLSHYEKGIRECGQSFLIKAADYYGVTCDYLLGRTAERQELDDFDFIFDTDNSDAAPMRRTLLKAIKLVSVELMKNNARHGIHLNEFIGAQFYKVVLTEAQNGLLPRSWAGDALKSGDEPVSELYLDLIERTAWDAIEPEKLKNPVPDSPVPEAVSTVIKSAEKAIISNTIEHIPPISLDLLK